MRIILIFLKKEFAQIFRNKMMLPIIFVIPLVQLLILVNAATMEMKSIRMVIVDNDLSMASRRLASHFLASKFFVIDNYMSSAIQAQQLMQDGKADVVLCINRDFEKQLLNESSAKVQATFNAINGMVAGIASSYIQAIMADYQAELIQSGRYNRPVSIGVAGTNVAPAQLNIQHRFWYNPELNYKCFMVPGVLVVLVTLVGMFLVGLNLVREKEIGTIEQINVTPVKKYQFIAGKLIPFWILALIELGVGLTIGKLIFDIPIEGSLFLLFAIAAIYLVIVLSIGLFVATITETQQQAMFIMFFVMIICIMMSGIFTSVETMPNWAQMVNHLNPAYYFMRVIRMILLKGSGFKDLLFEISCMGIYAVAMLTLAVRKYKKAVA